MFFSDTQKNSVVSDSELAKVCCRFCIDILDVLETSFSILQFNLPFDGQPDLGIWTPVSDYLHDLYLMSCIFETSLNPLPDSEVATVFKGLKGSTLL